MDNINSATIIIGVDTHKSTHVAVAINTQGARLAALSIPANAKGYQELESGPAPWAKLKRLGLKEPDHTELGCPERFFLWDIKSSKSRGQIVNCVTAMVKRIAWMRKVRRDPYSTGRLWRNPRPKPDPLK